MTFDGQCYLERVCDILSNFAVLCLSLGTIFKIVEGPGAKNPGVLV